MLTADVCQVPIGCLTIEGLMYEDGSYGVAVPQIVALQFVRPNQASKGLKAALGMDSPFAKVRTKLNSKAVNAVSLQDFEKLVLKLAIKQNPHAIAFAESLIGLSLEVVFDDAFGKESTKESRQLWLRNRQLTKSSFWFLTDDIKAWIDRNGSSCPQHHYIAAFKAMSMGLFGKTPKDIKTELGITKGDLNRDHFNFEALVRIDGVQRLAKPMIQTDTRPETAVNNAIAQFNYQVINYGKL